MGNYIAVSVTSLVPSHCFQRLNNHPFNLYLTEYYMEYQALHSQNASWFTQTSANLHCAAFDQSCSTLRLEEDLHFFAESQCEFSQPQVLAKTDLLKRLKDLFSKDWSLSPAILHTILIQIHKPCQIVQYIYKSIKCMWEGDSYMAEDILLVR